MARIDGRSVAVIANNPEHRGGAIDGDAAAEKAAGPSTVRCRVVFRRQGHGHIVTTVSTSGITISPTMGVYAATKNAARTIMEALRTESTDGVIRTTEISPGFVRTELADDMEPSARESIQAGMQKFGLDPRAVAKAVCFALEQPQEVEIGSLTIRPTVQG